MSMCREKGQNLEYFTDRCARPAWACRSIRIRIQVCSAVARPKRPGRLEKLVANRGQQSSRRAGGVHKQARKRIRGKNGVRDGLGRWAAVGCSTEHPGLPGTLQRAREGRHADRTVSPDETLGRRRVLLCARRRAWPDLNRPRAVLVRRRFERDVDVEAASAGRAGGCMRGCLVRPTGSPVALGRISLHRRRYI